MSGHSKWSTIKRKKGSNDAKRGQIFTRLARELAIAAREGGPDPDTNFSLRLAVDRARAENMPKDNIERAIKRGSGDDKDAADFVEAAYEGYGPHGVAIMIEVVTDNRNRTVSDIRHLLGKYGGSMGEAGSVSWQFNRVASFALSADEADFDEVFLLGVEAGADDVSTDGETIEILAPLEKFKEIGDQLRQSRIKVADAGLRMVPTHELELDPLDTLQVMRLIEALEDLDDTQNVYSNLHISEEALAELETA